MQEIVVPKSVVKPCLTASYPAHRAHGPSTVQSEEDGPTLEIEN